MSEAAARATIGAVIRFLCYRFPQAFTGRGQPRRPLKVGIHGDLVTALDGAVSPRALKAALRAYTSKPSYLRVLVAGTARVSLDGSPAGTVTSDEETAAKARLAEIANPAQACTLDANTSPVTQVAPAPSAPSPAPPAQPTAPPGPKRLSLADLREAARRRRGRRRPK
jgi:sRNA-binding protein